MHPSNPNHSAEIIIKRHTIENAVNFLIGKGLIEPQYSSQGIKYQNTYLGNKIADMFLIINIQKNTNIMLKK